MTSLTYPFPNPNPSQETPMAPAVAPHASPPTNPLAENPHNRSSSPVTAKTGNIPPKGDDLQACHNHIDSWLNNCHTEDRQTEDKQPEDPNLIPVSAPGSIMSIAPSATPTAKDRYRATSFLFNEPEYRYYNLRMLNAFVHDDGLPDFAFNVVNGLEVSTGRDLTAEQLAARCAAIAAIQTDGKCKRGEYVKEIDILNKLHDDIFKEAWHPVLDEVDNSPFVDAALLAPPSAHPEAIMASPKPHLVFGYIPMKTFPGHPMATIMEGLGRNGYSVTMNEVWLPYMIVIMRRDEINNIDGLFNHALTATTACVRLNGQLLTPEHNLCFTVLISDNNMVQILLTWFDAPSSSFRMKKIKRFDIESPIEYLKLRQCVHQIQAWAALTRLPAARRAMTIRLNLPLVQHQQPYGYENP
ncbi:hypothetical protein F5Y04DRAFT_244929 [Hypomontagnella monticulosa]|nr:hypothetical protein F5Y04DRAFT_244929 [Hypomontagnella monticulosa]